MSKVTLKTAKAILPLSEVVAEIHERVVPRLTQTNPDDPQIDLDRLITWFSIRRYQLKSEAVEKERIKTREEIMEMYPGRKYYYQFFKNESAARKWQKTNGGALYKNTPKSRIDFSPQLKQGDSYPEIHTPLECSL